MFSLSRSLFTSCRSEPNPYHTKQLSSRLTILSPNLYYTRIYARKTADQPVCSTAMRTPRYALTRATLHAMQLPHYQCLVPALTRDLPYPNLPIPVPLFAAPIPLLSPPTPMSILLISSLSESRPQSSCLAPNGTLAGTGGGFPLAPRPYPGLPFALAFPFPSYS